MSRPASAAARREAKHAATPIQNLATSERRIGARKMNSLCSAFKQPPPSPDTLLLVGAAEEREGDDGEEGEHDVAGDVGRGGRIGRAAILFCIKWQEKLEQ
jgi:hypothetical protein